MKKSTEHTGENSTPDVNSRRDFLKKAGKFAVYTPPAVMMLMKPSFAARGGYQKGSWMGRPNKSWQPRGRHSWKPDRSSWKPQRPTFSHRK